MSTVQVTEDQAYVFKAADFATNWPSLNITSLPTTGRLPLNGVAVTANQTILASDVTSGHLTFVPNTDVTTAGSFNFLLGGSEARTMTLNVTADVGPSALASSVQATENQTYTFKTGDFGYSDTADKTADALGSHFAADHWHPAIQRHRDHGGAGECRVRGRGSQYWSSHLRADDH